MKLNSLSFACGGRRLVSLSKGKSQNISIFIVVLDMMGMEGEDMMGMEGGHSWYKGGSDEDRGRTQWVQGKDIMGMEGGHMGTGREREQRKRMGMGMGQWGDDTEGIVGERSSGWGGQFWNRDRAQ